MTFFLVGGMINQGQLIEDGIFRFAGTWLNVGSLIQA